ncbi:hypothetical protein LRAMOSA10940 [Lichtheimia ramosa]|uniref:Beta-hexosaminidase n=1 Tax=Lichtheimia ramosa TaxID=688394 RepID=A0A077WQD0_9FUNG|nr:hypothetical protein LRAMOSA10940 [Lichtheimia ramosa]
MKITRAVLATTTIFPSISWALQGAFLWPVPQFIDSGATDVVLNITSFTFNAPDIPILKDAIHRYTDLVRSEQWMPVQVPKQPLKRTTVATSHLSQLDIIVDNPSAELDHGVDESYTLDIQEFEGRLRAATVWGALRGLETFSQLVQARPPKGNPILDYSEADADNTTMQLFIPETPIHIQDAPVYSHRGLMLDTSRNYFPVSDILRTIDAMAYNKMNVFHWHITDSQSFPLRLDGVPELAQQGAYVLNNRRLVYSKKDVNRVVEYARSRGIRVIPEIDMPAHTGSWAMAHNDLVTCNGQFFLDPSNEWSERLAAEPTTGQLNPVLEETYHLVEKVISEVASLFPDHWYHGGGDEPIYKCWEQDHRVQEYMSKYNATGDELLHMFLKKELEFIQKSGKTAILWEDSVTDNQLPISKDVVLQVWNKPVQEAAKKGYKVIASHANFWYLDCGHGGWTGNDDSYDEQEQPKVPESLAEELDRHQLTDNYRPSNWGGSGGDWCSPFKTWQRIYSYDMVYNLTKEEAGNVLGGEVALWAEQTDSTALDVRLWPRTAAAAEILWSGRHNLENEQRDLSDAMARIFDWRYRLVKRGIQAEALQPLWCGKNPSMCDSTFPEELEK